MPGQYDAGRAVGVYDLEARKALDTQLQLIKNYEALAKAANIKPPSFPVPTGGAGTTAKGAIDAQRLADAQNKAALSAQKLATEQQRTITAVTGSSRAEQQLARDTANAAAAQDRAATAALRRQQAEDRAAKGGGLGPALPRTFAGFTANGLASLGIAASIPGIVSFGVEANKASISLERQLRLTKELTGTQAAYNQVIAAAKTQQQLYGGSLEENIAGIQGLVVTARSTGAELNTLINLAQRLAVLDPAQGAEGARIALSEVLSGDPRSLSRRYEIPLSALEKIKDESIPVADRLKVLDQYLNKIGITSAAVNDVVTDQAKVYNNLEAATDQAKVAVGGLLTTLLQYPATVTTNVLVNVSNGLTQIKDLDKNLQDVAVRAFAGAKSFDDYGKRITFVNEQLGGVGARAAQLSPALFAYAQGLQATGLSAEAAFNQAFQYRNIIDGISEAQQRAGGAGGTWGQVLSSLGERAAQVAAQSEANRVGVESLVLAYQNGSLTSDQFNAALLGLEAQQARNILAAQEEERENRRLALSFADIVPAANSAAAAIAALAGARAGLPEDRHIGGTGNTTGRLTGIFGGGAGATFARVDAQQRALQDSRDELALANAKTNAQKIAIYQRQLDRQTSEENRNRILAQIASLKSTGGGRTPKNPNAVGLSVLDQDAIQAGATAADQLAEVNRQLAQTNLTEHQRNDLLEKRRKLEEQITDEREKQNRAALDAQLGTIQDAQKRLQEQRQAAGLQRALDSGRLAGTPQEQAARLKLQEIALEQQKRALDIQKDLKTAGLATPGQTPGAPIGAVPNVPTPALPIPNLAQLPPLQPGAITVNLTVNVDQAGKATITQSDPNVILNIIGTATNFRNLSGGVNG